MYIMHRKMSPTCSVLKKLILVLINTPNNFLYKPGHDLMQRKYKRRGKERSFSCEIGTGLMSMSGKV